MLTIVDLNRNEELSPRSMTEVVGALGDIQGESWDARHKDWIEVLSYNASDVVMSKVAVSDITVTKPIDKASIGLF